MSWFVYMSTLGNPHVDYLVTDPVTVPEDLAQHMSGHMLYLPETFFPNSHAFMFPLSDIEGA
jgi:protein O-GlcNAc transferase